jgi:gliding motility-associated-like protein
MSTGLCLTQDLSIGLVAYYSFCDCTASDHSGNENHATLVGNPVCSEGIKGQGFQFNTNAGLNDCGQRGGDYIRMPTLESVWDGGFSVCAWVQYENVANFERIIDIGNGSGELGGLPLWFGREGNSDNLTLESWVDADPNTNRTTGRLVAQNAITNGQIEFYCATIDDRTMSIYVNGELVAQKEGHPIRNVRRTENFIGRSNWCTADPDFAGFMDEVRLYNRPLSAEEIRLLYDSPALVTGPNQVCLGEPAQLEAQGGVRYEWTPNTFLDASNIPNPIAIADRDTTIDYQVSIFFPDDCSVTDTLSLRFDACVDCAGVPNGSAIVDDCGVCLQPDDPNFNQSCVDCAGVIGGTSVVDSCGICLEANSPDFNQSCTDCAGIPNGGAQLNECGVCLSPDDPAFGQPCIGKDIVYIPTAFSPNQDGVNDEWGIYGDPTYVEKIEVFQVKDRWGNLVFELSEQPLGGADTFWDGTSKGEVCVQGVYLYRAIVTFKNGASKVLSGTLTLMK